MEPATGHIDRRIAWMLSLLVFTSVSCKKDKDDEVVPIAPVNEEEVITTVILKFIHDSDGVNANCASRMWTVPVEMLRYT
ncbi:MAG: hypothetical protein R2818_15540 [Flavobacteriales bacterium]